MALTVSSKKIHNVGDLTLITARLTGDGSTSTFNTHLSHVVFAVVTSYNETTPVRVTSWSGGTITFSGAIASGSSTNLLVLGTA